MALFGLFQKRSKTNPNTEDMLTVEKEENPLRMDKNLFVEERPPVAEKEIAEHITEGILSGIKGNIESMMNRDLHEKGLRDCMALADRSVLSEGARQIIDSAINELNQYISLLATRSIDIEKRIRQLEEAELKDIAFEMEAVKREHEYLLNTCQLQLKEIEYGKGWVSYQLSSYKMGFNKAWQMHIMNDFKH